METSIKRQPNVFRFKRKVLEVMNAKGMIAPFLTSSLLNLFKPEDTGQIELLKDPRFI